MNTFSLDTEQPRAQVSARRGGRFWLVQAVTFARVPLGIAFAAALLSLGAEGWRMWLGVVLLALIELSDMLDGLLARRLNTVTEWGAMLDPYADSVSRIIVYWALATAGLPTAARSFAVPLVLIPLVMTVRDITVAYCRIIWIRSGRSVSARLSGKLKAIVQGTGGFFLLCGARAFPQHSHWVLPATCWIVLVVTLASLAEYVAATLRPPHGNPNR